MDQKNTIVKCNRSPKCLFEHNGVCDNYVINISADGQCACYIEPELPERSDATFTFTMKVAEFNKSNKNKTIISDYNYTATPDICKTCKKVIYGQPCKYKAVSYGIWTCYEEEKNEI